MKKCLLPFTLDVDMKAYHSRAFPLGVIKANIRDYDIWLCNKLINCLFRENGGRMQSFDSAIWSEDIGLTKIEKKYLKCGEFNQSNFDIIAENKEALKSGTYIVGEYDEYFIKGKKPYHKRHYNHDYMLFGYDDKEEVFKSAAYMADGRYRFYDISYKDYYDSVVKSEYNLWIYYMKIDKAFVPQVDITHIKNKLENYLFSKEEYISAKKVYFGMDAWNKLEEYVYELSEIPLDVRYGRLYMEHRGVMLKRIHKLNEMGFLDDDSLIEDYHENIFLPAQVIHYLFIKYNLTGNVATKNRILEVMQKTNEQERILIGKVLEEINAFT